MGETTREPSAAPVVPAAAVARRPAPAYVTWMFCIYLLLMPAGDAALRWANAAAGGTPISPDREIFTVVNALTLSGFQLIIGASTYPGAAQAVVLLLTLLGILFPLVVGGLAVVRIVGLPYTDREVMRFALVASATFVALGCIPLVGQYTPFQAVMLSASAFGNGGLYFGHLPDFLGWETHLVLMPLAVVGGLGLPVLMELYDKARRRERALSVHARTVLGMTAGLYLAFFLACFALRLPEMGRDPALPPRTLAEDVSLAATLAGSSSIASLNTRTAGFPIPFVQDFPTTMQWLLILSMIVGGSPGGTAGGLKTTTVAALWRGVRGALGGSGAPGRAFGMAAAWTATYLLCTGILFLLLLVTVPQVVPERLLFLAVSAMSNVGLSHETISFVKPGLHVLSLGMVVGRLAPLIVLWWMAQTTPPTDLATA